MSCFEKSFLLNLDIFFCNLGLNNFAKYLQFMPKLLGELVGTPVGNFEIVGIVVGINELVGILDMVGMLLGTFDLVGKLVGERDVVGALEK